MCSGSVVCVCEGGGSVDEIVHSDASDVYSVMGEAMVDWSSVCHYGERVGDSLYTHVV